MSYIKIDLDTFKHLDIKHTIVYSYIVGFKDGYSGSIEHISNIFGLNLVETYTIIDDLMLNNFIIKIIKENKKVYKERKQQEKLIKEEENKEITKRDNTSNNTRYNTRDNSRDNTRNNTRNNTRDKTSNNTSNNTRDNTSKEINPIKEKNIRKENTTPNKETDRDFDFDYDTGIILDKPSKVYIPLSKEEIEKEAASQKEKEEIPENDLIPSNNDNVKNKWKVDDYIIFQRKIGKIPSYNEIMDLLKDNRLNRNNLSDNEIANLIKKWRL